MPSYFRPNVSQSPQNIWSITVIYFLVCCSVVRGQTATQPPTSGPNGDTLLISNIEHLYHVAINANTGYFGKYLHLTTNIDASATSSWANGWPGIAGTGTSGFRGIFDGKGFSITNLTIKNPASAKGLFKEVRKLNTGDPAPEIKNLYLGVTYDFSNALTGSVIGGLTGWARSANFTNVQVSVEHLTLNSSQLTSFSYGLVGGVVGQCYASNFTDCSSESPRIYSKASRSGGFVGNAEDASTFNSCYAHTTQYALLTIPFGGKHASQNPTGGFHGYAKSDCVFNDCYTRGDIYGSIVLLGFGQNGIANRCYAAVTMHLWGPATTPSNFNGCWTFTNGMPTITDCVVDGTLSNSSLSSGGGTNVSTTSLPYNPSSYPGFNFTTTWDLDGITNSGYPFLRAISSTIALNISTPATSYTLPPSQTIQVLPGVKIEVGTLNLNGSNLVLNANSSSYSQLKFSSLSGSGGIEQENYISSGAHMISSSVASGFTNSSGDESKLYSYNAATGAWNSIGSSTGIPGVGYFANVDPSNNPFISAAGTSQVSGTPNTSNTWSVSYAVNTAPMSGNASSSGWNLLGNPYTCGLDWTLVPKTNLNTAYYVWDASTNSYLYYGGSGGGTLTGVIPPMQAFWVQATGSSSIATTMSAHGTVASSPTYYKTRPDNLVLQAALLGDTLISDRMWVAHVSGTTSSFDGANDAWKMTNGPLMPNIYSYVDAEGMAINALDLNGNQIIPVGFDYVDVGAKFRITLEQVTNGQVYQVYLEDKALQQFHDLNQGDYPFTHQVWTQEGPRFALHVSQSTVGTEESDASPTSLVIYQDGGRLMVHWYDSDQANYRLVTLDGKDISKGAIQSGLQSLNAPEASGVYILELEGPSGVQRQKFLISH